MIFAIKTAIFIESILLVSVVVFRGALRPQFRHLLGAGDILLVVSIPLIGLFGYDKSVFYGFLFVAPLFWAANPAHLAKRYVLALVSFPELSISVSSGGHFLGIWSALLSLNAGALLALAFTKSRGLKHSPSIDSALWLMFCIALLMTARGADFTATLRAAIVVFVLLVPPYYVVSRTLTSAKATADLISFLVLGGICNACVGIVEAAKHWAIYETMAGLLHVPLALTSANLSVRAGLLRAGGAFINYEIFGLFCGMALLATIGLRRRFTLPGWGGVIMILATGLVVSQARSAWIAMAAGVLVQAAYDRRWGRAVACIGGFGVIVVAVSTILPNGETAAQLIGTRGHGASTYDYRQRLLNRGLEEARQHLWIGQTLDQLQVSMNDLRQGQHIIDFVNTHLNVLLVGGVGAMAVWLVAWCIPLVQGWRSRPDNRHDDPVLTSLPFAWLVMIILFLAFTSAVDRAFPLAMISMAVLGAGLSLRRKITSVHESSSIGPPTPSPHSDRGTLRVYRSSEATGQVAIP